MLLLWDIWYHLKKNILDRLDHYFLKRYKALINVFIDGEVVESQLFGDLVFEDGFYFFLEGIIFSFEHLEKIVMR